MNSHPLAELLPGMTDDQFVELREDIAAHGLRDAIVLHQGKVLDGRHRLRACHESGVEPRFVDFSGDAPAEFVLSVNVKRRHLTPSQRAALAVEFLPALEIEARARQTAHLKRGDVFPSGSPEPNGHRAREEAGARVGVSGASVDRARRIKREDPEMFEQVRNGTLPVRAADDALRQRRSNGNREKRRITPAAIETERGKQQAAAHKRRVIQVVSTVSGYARGLDEINVEYAAHAMTDGEMKGLAAALTDSLAALRGLRNQMKEHA